MILITKISRGVFAIALSVFLAGNAIAQQSLRFETRLDVPQTRFMVSETITLAGLTGETAISVNTGNDTQYSIDKGPFTNDAGVVNNGQLLTLRHVSGSTASASTVSVVMVGAQSTTYRTVTQAAVVRHQISVAQIGSGAGTQSFTISPESACETLTANELYECDAGTSVTITAQVPAADTYFSGWYDTVECVHTGLDGPDQQRPYNPACTFSLTTPRTLTASFATVPALTPDTEAAAPTCDNIVPQHCFFPFPSNVFTRAATTTDPSSLTGLQVNLVPAGRFPTPRPDDGSTGGGAQFDPTQWNRNDGFSVNPKINTFIDSDPGAAQVGLDEDDLDATGVTHLVDLSRALEADAPVLLINATPLIDGSGNPCTGDACIANPEYLKRTLIWVEPELPKRELRDTDVDGAFDTRVIPDSERTLTIRVGKNLNYRHRYIVALRNFKRADGTRIEAEPNFRVYRDAQALGDTFPNMEARRAAMESIFATLAEANIPRWNLTQAWDFTVISQENLHKRILHMRDTAIAALGDDGVPCYTVELFPNASAPEQPAFGGVSPPYTSSTCSPGVLPAEVPGNSGVTEDNTAQVLRTIDGTIAVPCFMTGNCAPGNELHYNPAQAQGEHPVFGDDLPDQPPGSIFKANFRCRIPASASGDNPARISLYGHGLLGSLSEVGSSHVRVFGVEHNILFCALNWTGFATEDAGTAARVGSDISGFSTFIDRQMQGHIAWLIMMELLVRDGGLAAHPAMRTTENCPGGADSCPLYKLDFDADGSGGMFYDGNSQGGIMAGAMISLSSRVRHAVLGVPGMNYSILLRRSSDFQIQEGEEPAVGATAINFALQQNFPNDFDLSFIYSLSTMVWERSENAGFASNMTDNPLPGAPPHAFLLHPGYGDHQVTMWSNDIIARSGGMRIIDGMIDPNVRYTFSDPVSGTLYGEQKPYFGIPVIESYPFVGSALVEWDSGVNNVDNPVLYNAPPRTGQDPHEHVRRTKAARLQKSLFMRSDQSGGAVFDTCSEPDEGSSGQDGGVCSSENHD